MSVETVQFVEIVRQALTKLSSRMTEEGQGMLRCDICGCQAMTYERSQGNDEIYRCLGCGCTKAYRVR